MNNTDNDIAKDVAAIVAKHGATAVLTQLQLAADMVVEHANDCDDQLGVYRGWSLRRGLDTAVRACHELDKHLVRARTSAMGLISATDILANTAAGDADEAKDERGATCAKGGK